MNVLKKSLLVPGEHANNSSRNVLCTFNLFPYIWFPLFKLTLFNHTEEAIKRCSGKTALLGFKTHKKLLKNKKISLRNTSEGVHY